MLPFLVVVVAAVFSYTGFRVSLTVPWCHFVLMLAALLPPGKNDARPAQEISACRLCVVEVVPSPATVSFRALPNPLSLYLPVCAARSRYASQQIGMDDSKHGGQTYPEMVKGPAKA